MSDQTILNFILLAIASVMQFNHLRLRCRVLEVERRCDKLLSLKHQLAEELITQRIIAVEPTLDDVDIETDYGAATLLTDPHFGCVHFEVKP